MDKKKLKQYISELDKTLGTESEKELETPKSLRTTVEILNLIAEDSKAKDVHFNELNKTLQLILSKKEITPTDLEPLQANLKGIETLITSISKKDDTAQIKAILDQIPTILKGLTPYKEVKVSNQIKDISINNLPSIQKVEVVNQIESVKQVKVDNFPEKVQVEVINFPEKEKALSEMNVKVVNDISVKEPKWYQKPWKMDSFLNKLESMLNALNRKTIERLTTSVYEAEIDKHKRADQAIAVRLVDNDGKFIDKLIPNVLVNPPGGGGGGGTATGTATAEKQDEQTALLTKIEDNTANITVNIENLDVNLDDLEALTGKTVKTFYGENTSVPSNTETVIATATVPALKKWKLKFAFAEGNRDGVFIIYKNSSKLCQGRNSWGERNVSINIEEDLIAGDTVSLKVLHNNLLNSSYSGRLQFYEL